MFFNTRMQVPTRFEYQFYCTSTAAAGKDLDDGDKIFLPPSALDKLARMNVEYPMLFEVTNSQIGRKTHCGVLEFSAEEGWCYMPFWMMQNLMIEEGNLITVKNVSLPKATFVKFQAQSCDFLEVTNPRAHLEVELRRFTCLTVGDVICIPYLGGKKFYLKVNEVQPNGAASIIETDCNVDFDEPVGYKESKYAQYERDREKKQAEANAGSGIVSGPPRVLQKARVEDETNNNNNNQYVFKAFSGNAKRIDGKTIANTNSNNNNNNNGTISNDSSIKTEKSETKSNDSKSETSSNNSGVPLYQSSIGDKYSKKKVAVSAFAGVARKLN